MNRYFLFSLIILFVVCNVISLKYLNHTDNNIRDLCHEYLPKIKYRYQDALVPIIVTYMIYVLYNTKKLYLLKDYGFLILILYIIRFILHQVTILPTIKRDDENIQKKCTTKGINITGGCNDYIFSGHMTSIILPILFIMYATGKISIFLILYGILSGFTIIMTHEHYTVDVLLALIISILSFSSHFLCQANNQCSKFINL